MTEEKQSFSKMHYEVDCILSNLYRRLVKIYYPFSIIERLRIELELKELLRRFKLTRKIQDYEKIIDYLYDFEKQIDIKEYEYRI